MDKEATINKLIDEEGSWKTCLILEVLNEEDAKVIKCIPISKRGSEDKVIRELINNRLFSVKSAYHLEITLKKKKGGEQWSREKSPVGWKHIWDLNIPNIIKAFLRKVVSVILPTKSNLYRTKVTKDDICPICN